MQAQLNSETDTVSKCVIQSTDLEKVPEEPMYPPTIGSFNRPPLPLPHPSYFAISNVSL